MTMKLTRLTTYWDASDAYAVISFLDELREVLWTTYHFEIIEMLKEAQRIDDQLDLDFDETMLGE